MRRRASRVRREWKNLEVRSKEPTGEGEERRQGEERWQGDKVTRRGEGKEDEYREEGKNLNIRKGRNRNK